VVNKSRSGRQSPHPPYTYKKYICRFEVHQKSVIGKTEKVSFFVFQTKLSHLQPFRWDYVCDFVRFFLEGVVNATLQLCNYATMQLCTTPFVTTKKLLFYGLMPKIHILLKVVPVCNSTMSTQFLRFHIYICIQIICYGSCIAVRAQRA
jgi:hypothetical protein